MIGDIIEIERARRSLPDAMEAPALPRQSAPVGEDRRAHAIVQALIDAMRWIGGSGNGKASEAAAAGRNDGPPAEPVR